MQGAQVEEAAPKTLSEILFEQLTDVVALWYGDRLHVLWSGVSKRDCEASMAQTGSIVTHWLDRCRADFAKSGICMSLARSISVLGSALQAPEGRS